MMIKMMMCREITKLMSRRLDTSLSLKEKLSLHMHIAMCGACKECNKQFELLHLAGYEYQNLAVDTDTAYGSDDTSKG